MIERRERNWIFTIFENEEKEIDIDEIYDRMMKESVPKPCSWIVCGKEVCPTTKRRHLQGALYFKNGKTRRALQRWSGGGKHYCETMRSTAKKNKDYCSKEGDWFEEGEFPTQGKRNDILSVREALQDGANMRNIVLTTKNLQGIQYAQKYLTHCEKERDWKPKVIWYWGKPESGKSLEARGLYKNAYYANDTNKWWDGYDAHKCVVIDDMRGDFCKFHEFLRLIDRYPYRVEVKGGYRQMVARTMIITSCHEPMFQWMSHGGIKEDMEQLMRRITKVIHCKKIYWKIRLFCVKHICALKKGTS